MTCAINNKIQASIATSVNMHTYQIDGNQDVIVPMEYIDVIPEFQSDMDLETTSCQGCSTKKDFQDLCRVFKGTDYLGPATLNKTLRQLGLVT